VALTTVSNNALSNITAIPASIPTGALTLIKSITASSSASISFVDGTDGVVFDDTYKSYVFKFIDVHPSTEADNTAFHFQCSTDGGSNYNTTMTSTHFRAANYEDDSDRFLSFNVTQAQSQDTDFASLINGSIGTDNDQSASGFLQIFNPADTTFVKHFISTVNSYNLNNVSMAAYNGGYFNTTSAIDAIQFKFSAGNVDNAIIKMYGVS
jgi:hypothetical protein